MQRSGRSKETGLSVVPPYTGHLPPKKASEPDQKRCVLAAAVDRIIPRCGGSHVDP